MIGKSYLTGISILKIIKYIGNEGLAVK